jgi:L-ornithine Nalpha-acyltransferase
MSKLYWKPVRTVSELDHAQRLRFRCLSDELGISVVNDPHVERDVCSTDCLSSTEHVLVYDDQRCVATARITLPNPDIASASGTHLGLELEEAGIDLAPLHELSTQLAEISRLCVLREWHGTAAAARLYEGLYVLTRQRGVRYWLGGVDCRTSLLEEAELMRSVLARRGHLSTQYQLSAKPEAPNHSRRGVRSASPFYTPKQLALAEQGHTEALPIAGALAAFTKRLAAHCIGRPVLHQTFPRYVLPMLVDLEQLPRATWRMFDGAQLAALPTAKNVAPSHLFDARRIAS